MTDQLAALRFLVNAKSSKGIIVGEKALAKFYTQWSHEALVIDQWFAVQATSQRDDSLVKVWNTLTNKNVLSLENDCATSLCTCTDDEEFIITADVENNVKIWRFNIDETGNKYPASE